jgi:hypothetical protein
MWPRKRENKKGTSARITRYKFCSNKKGSQRREPFSFALQVQSAAHSVAGRQRLPIGLKALRF